ncbi:MAG: nucleotidyltransferase family protein [Prevotella sp.]|jgi:NDP-sugar pyrophosphorylase family protein
MKQAMIFAAGLGTRLKPLTDTMPKALVPVAGQPLLWHVIQKLKDAGFERIVVNVHHFAQQIIDYLKDNDDFGLDIRISDETEQLLETGGGIKKALPLFDPDSPILIHNVDILSNVNLSALYDLCVQDATTDALLLVSQRNTKRYLLFDDDMRLRGWTNIETGEVRPPSTIHPSPSTIRLAFSGIHVLSPGAFPLFASMPDRFSIIEFYLKYCHQQTFVGREKKDLRMMDVGKIDTLDQAIAFIETLRHT